MIAGAATPFDAALEADNRGDTAKARALYEALIAEIPDHGRARINLGLLEIRAGRVKRGKAHCDQALNLEPDAAKVHYCLGLASLGRDSNAARLAFERSLELLPDDPAPKLELGHLHRKAKRYDQAVQMYREAVRHRPDDPDLHVNLGYCYRKLGKLPAARVEYSKAVQKDPTSFFGHLDLGWVLVKLKDYKSAEKHYLIAAQLRDDSADPHYNLGNLYKRTGQTLKSADAYAGAVKRDPKDVQARMALVRMAWRAHRPAVAEANLKALSTLTLSPNQQVAVGKLGKLIKRKPPVLKTPAPLTTDPD